MSAGSISSARRDFEARQDEGPRPLVVVVRVTTHCGLACRYCGFSREVLLPRREIDADQLLAFGQALSEFQTATGRPVLVSWLGGEPYQWSRLWPVSERFQRQYGLSLGITTNGNALASQQIRQQTKLRFDQLTLSVDGLAADHDAVRQRPGGYVRLRESCQRLREEDRSGTLWIRVNMVLMRSNIAHFAGACRELIAWGVNEVTFNQLGGNDRPEFYPENCLLPEQVASFRAELPKLREEFSSHGVRIAGSDHYLSRIAATTAGRRMPIEDCRPGTRFLFVDEAGRVSPCSFTSRSCSVTMTQLTAGHQITDLPQMLAERRAAAPIAACRDCHATHMFDKFERVSEDRNISSPRSPRPPR